MTDDPASYPRHRFPAEIISHAVWLYHVFSLSLRDVELIPAERGVLVTHESIRLWGLKFGGRPLTKAAGFPALEQHRAQLICQPGPRRDQSLAARCSTCRSSCASLLSVTRGIVGRVAASAIASASRSSVFCDFT